MLTDEEIIKIAADTKTGEPGLYGYILPISFAREIERAVLAKAMPIPKQEPVAVQYRYLNHDTNSFGEWGDKIKGKTGGFQTRNLYAEPVPAQAAAIPEIIRERMNMLFDSINGDAYVGETEERHLVSQIKEWISESPKPE